MNKRFETIYSEIQPCASFADVGCDHGYITEAVLDGGKCSNAVISDISARSLEKAKKLLKKYIDDKKVQPVVCDGLKLVPECETVLIAGMGGEEMIKILKESPFKPKKLILSPMKNQDKVRFYLQNNGYGIVKDYTFFAERFYHLIRAESGRLVKPYDRLEYEFGRDNLERPTGDFIAYLNKELEKAETYRDKVVSEEDKKQFDETIKTLKVILNENK